MVPFLEHIDVARTTFGMNMMRQWMTPRKSSGTDAERSTSTYPERLRETLSAGKHDVTPEPALVTTGQEPDETDFWGGYNLLTAFVMWDGDSFEDALVISASAAAKMAFPVPVEVGDKINNRHGFKGVVSRILPDNQMP